MKKILDWMRGLGKAKIIALATGVFVLAAKLGSTLLTPEQREAILNFLPLVLSLIGVN